MGVIDTGVSTLRSWFADTATGANWKNISTGQAAVCVCLYSLYKPCPPLKKSFPPLPTATSLPSTRKLLKLPTVRITRECAFKRPGSDSYVVGWQRCLTRSSSFVLTVPRWWISVLLVMMPLLKLPRVFTPRATSPRVSIEILVVNAWMMIWHVFIGIGFPTSVSLNNCVAHFSPLPSDPESATTLKTGDVAKM